MLSAEAGAGVGLATATGLDDAVGTGVGVAIATEGVGVTRTSGVGVAVMLATEGMGVTTEVVPDPPKRIVQKIASAIVKAPPKIAQTISLRFGGGASCACGRTDGGVACGDTGILFGRPAAAMFSFSAFQNS